MSGVLRPDINEEGTSIDRLVFFPENEADNYEKTGLLTGHVHCHGHLCNAKYIWGSHLRENSAGFGSCACL